MRVQDTGTTATRAGARGPAAQRVLVAYAAGGFSLLLLLGSLLGPRCAAGRLSENLMVLLVCRVVYSYTILAWQQAIVKSVASDDRLRSDR